MKLTYEDVSVGYLTKGSRNYTEQSLYEDGSAVASISTVGGNNEEHSEEIFEDSADESEISADTEEAQEPAESSTTDGMREEVITEADSEALGDSGLL